MKKKKSEKNKSRKNLKKCGTCHVIAKDERYSQLGHDFDLIFEVLDFLVREIVALGHLDGYVKSATLATVHLQGGEKKKEKRKKKKEEKNEGR